MVSSAQVVYKLASSTTWSPAQTTSVADRAFELVVADLQPQSHYHVKVRARGRHLRLTATRRLMPPVDAVVRVQFPRVLRVL